MSSATSKQSVVVATRVHRNNAGAFVDISKILRFVESSRAYADKILIIVGAGDQLEYREYVDAVSDAVRSLEYGDVVVVQPVTPWGSFTTALNAALRHAVDTGHSRILYQSLEVVLSAGDVEVLGSYLDENTLVVGPSLLGHEFTEGPQTLRGRTCPWNTAALWNVSKLALIGFPMIGDGVPSHSGTDGVEEVSTVAVLQLVQPHLRAVLLHMKDRVSWNVTDFAGDEERKLYHERKMASKDSRPAIQLEALGIRGKGEVLHISHHG